MKQPISNSGKLWVDVLSGRVVFGDERLGKVATSDIDKAILALRNIVLVRGVYDAKLQRRNQIMDRLASHGILFR